MTARIWTKTVVLACLALSASSPLLAGEPVATQKMAISVDSVVSGLDQPWSVEVLPDGAYLITELPGRLRIIRDGKPGAPVKGLPKVHVGGQGGLLDVALAPDFATSRRLYLTAALPGPGGQGTGVLSARLSNDESELTEVQQIFVMDRMTGKGQHFGSRIAIADDGTLFFGIGDRGDMDRAQDPNDHAGSILRIATDGSVPKDNPFAAGGGKPEIWSTGHRNPQGIVIDRADGRLYTVEHGARGGDEINMPKPGGNFGWPVVSYGKHYSGAEIGLGQAADGYEQPLYYWDPSIAPGAIDIYHGAMFPEWEGNLLVAALKYQLLARLERDEEGRITHEERLLAGDYGRLRDVKVAPDGSVLLLTDGDGAKLLRITRAPSP